MICYADNSGEGVMYRATPGASATTAFAYFNDTDGFAFGDIRGEFKIDDNATTMVYRSFNNTRIYRVDLNTNMPQEISNAESLQFMGINSRTVPTNIDMSADGSRWFFGSELFSNSLTPPSNQFFWIGSGSGATLEDNFSDPTYASTTLNITDDGSMYAYCEAASGLNAPTPCFVQPVGGGTATQFGDGRTTNTALQLVDEGGAVFYRTDGCCSGGTGIFETLATSQKIAAGTQKFAPDWRNVRLSDDGTKLVGGSSFGVYVLHHGEADLPNFPTISDISYRMDDAECKLVVRVTASSPRGIERIFVNPYNDAVDPTVFVDGEANPTFSIRFGGGVNLSTTFTEIGNNVWERDIPLTNSVGACASQSLTSDFSFRIIVVDQNNSMTVFKDFVVSP